MPTSLEIPTDLPSRIVFSLLRGGVLLAARMGVPLKQVVHLVRLAYYQELRERHPRDRKQVADELGVSLRTAAQLGKELKQVFTASEETVVFSRQVRAAIDRQALSAAQLAETLDADLEQVEDLLELLRQNGWARETDGRWRVHSGVQSYVGGALNQKIDGLNRLQDVVADAAFGSFFTGETQPSTARTWVFHADAAAFERFRDEALLDLRTRTVELDENSLASEAVERVGVTVVFSRMQS